jgi:hypothetical protein
VAWEGTLPVGNFNAVVTAALWISEYPLTFSEKMNYGLDRGLHKRFYLPVVIGTDGNDAFHFGDKPFLYARKVSNLRAE